jgi:hypothetical protein
MTKPKIIPQPTTELGQLLGTEDRGQHPAKVRELAQIAQASVLSVLIVHDPRGGRTTVNVVDSQGNSVAFATAHQILDAGRAALIRQETAAKAEQAKAG